MSPVVRLAALVSTFLFASLALGASPALEPTVWRLDSLAKVGRFDPAVLGAPQLRPDVDGIAITFNGSSDGLIIPGNPLEGLTAFTVEMEIRPEAKGPAEQRFFHIQDHEATSRALLELRLTPDGRWALDAFLASPASRHTLLDMALLHPAERWHWVAMRYENGRLESFVNGVKELEGPVDFLPMKPGLTSIGVRLNQVFWYKGAIRELRIHRRAIPIADLAR